MFKEERAMRCLLLRGLTFSATVLLVFAARLAVADDDGFPNTLPSGEIRVLGGTSTVAKDPGAVRYPESVAPEGPSNGDSSPAKDRPTIQERIKGAAPKAVPADERSKAKPIGEPSQSAVDLQEGPPIGIEATSFKGVAPGMSTQEDVAKAWGQPKKSTQINSSLVQLYTVEPFKRVEVNYSKGKVSSVVIRLDNPFPVEAVTKHLDLTAIRAVVVCNEQGEVLGRAYPERGVLLGAAPSDQPAKAPMKVAQIIIEPISAESFVLRAEAAMAARPDLSRHDLEQALSLEPGNSRAHWLYSRVLAATERQDKSLKEAAEAVRLDPNNPQYRVTYAQVLAQTGQLPEATEEAKKAMAASADRPHVKARATCLLGDLVASGPNPDFRKALALHTQAIQLADPLSSDSRTVIRVAAKEVLVDAHLSAAHDIAWGEWKDKSKAVTRWLDRATTGAMDLVNNEGASEEQLFRVHVRSLAAYVGVRGQIDPDPTVKAAVMVGEKLINAARDPRRKAQFQSELGTAIYDAVQVCQMRTEPDAALSHGEAAAKYLADSIHARPSPASSLLLGRLYFRMGTMQAMHKRDHKAAVGCFEKAIPLMERAATEDLAGDLGRHGEAFVGMGVSYWETGRRDKAVALTQQGIKLMERAAQEGTIDRATLAIPYSNLAAMHRTLGDNDQADRLQSMADRAKGKKLK
jgi:tetratricopeptide (TPR) repeat protein